MSDERIDVYGVHGVPERGKREKPDYFGEALSNFAHDVASGGAIRHMVNLGYSVDEIRRRLDFPTPRERVQRTVYEYMQKSGILLEALPGETEQFAVTRVRRPSAAGFGTLIRDEIEKNGEENSYLTCTYGMIYRDREARLARLLDCLSTREREYLLGIPWERKPMYHRLNGRMAEIGIQLALYSGAGQEFWFLKSREVVRTGEG